MTTAIDFIEDCFTGATVRVYAKDLCDIDTGPVTTGATVTIDRYNPDGSLGEVGTIQHSGDDWYANFLVPDLLGTHTIKLTADYQTKVWKGLGYLIVRPW
jgi:hypothetical protein